MKEERFPTPKDFDLDIPASMEDLFLDTGAASTDFDDLDLTELAAILGDAPMDFSEADAFHPVESLPDSASVAEMPEDTLLSVEEEPEAIPVKAPASKRSFSPKSKKLPPAAKGASGNKGKIIALCTAAVVVLLCVGGILIPRILDPYDNRILPNTTVGGVDVGGMTRMEAYKALKEATAFSQQAMEVTLPDGTITLSPDNTKAKFRGWKAASEAFRIGRRGTEEEKQSAYTASQGNGNHLGMLPFLELDQEYIRAQLEAYAAKNNVAHTELQYHLEGSQPPLAEEQYSESAVHQTLVLTLGTPLQELDVDAVLGVILEAYSQNTLQVTIASIEYKTTPAAPDLDAIYEEFYIPPVNTTLDMTAYRQVPGAYGYALDMDVAKELLSQAQYGETIRIPMCYVKPEILGDEAYFREELGYCETKHTNNENRNTNLTLACAAIDGLILQPGEEFSFNTTVGERTAEKGYKPAAAYSGTRTVDSIGGGVCQVSSTLYNAALIADMEIVHRVNHGFRSSYIAIGLDATVNWGGPDFQFRNNAHFPVMIKAEVSDGFVKIKLLGTDEKDYYIKMTSGYDEDDNYYYSWSYKNKYDKETDELISKEREAYSSYMK